MGILFNDDKRDTSSVSLHSTRRQLKGLTLESVRKLQLLGYKHKRSVVANKIKTTTK